MKRITKAVYTLLLFAAVWAAGFPAVTVSAAAGSVNNMNVVFVLDGSGSMYTTDQEKLRFEALELFLGLSTEYGNSMGAVVFDDGILLTEDLAPVNGKEAKSRLSEKVRSASGNGDTDIGRAIYKAVQMLRAFGNPDLPSAIILLSDGNTDLPKDKSGKLLEASLRRKAEAIDHARKREISIHSVCLNANGKAKKEELQEISDATGGTCVEVKKASDLKDVFNQFYNIIYATKTIHLVDTKIPKSGELRVPFSIPVIGVKEANIIINTLNAQTTYSLFHPDGYAFTKAELEQMAVQAKTFTVIKIEKPEPGEWELVVRGARKDQVKIDMVYNTDLSIQLEETLVQSQGNQAVWELGAQVSNEGEAAPKEVYQQYPFWIQVTDQATGEKTKLEMKPDGGRCAAQLETEGYGTYKVQAFCEIDDMKVKSNAKTIQKPNTKPEWKQETIVIDETYHLFSKSLFTLDLNTLASDAEDDELVFAVADSQFSEEEVFLQDGSVLACKIKICGDGSLTVTAADQAGATAQGEIEIHTTSVTGKMLLILALALLLAVLILLFPVIRPHFMVVRGTVQILTYGEDGTDPPVTFDGEKGRMLLSKYVHPAQEIGMRLEKCYLMAGEKNGCIYFVSAQGYYTDRDGAQKKKKIRVDAGMELQISSDPDFANGIRITYMPYQD